MSACERIITRAHGVVASHPLRMRKALGSNPSVSMRARTGRCGKARRLSGGLTCTATGAPAPQWLPRSCVGDAQHAAARHTADRASFTGTCLRAHGVVDHIRSACGRPWVQIPVCPLAQHVCSCGGRGDTAKVAAAMLRIVLLRSMSMPPLLC